MPVLGSMKIDFITVLNSYLIYFHRHVLDLLVFAFAKEIEIE